LPKTFRGDNPTIFHSATLATRGSVSYNLSTIYTPIDNPSSLISTISTARCAVIAGFPTVLAWMSMFSPPISHIFSLWLNNCAHINILPYRDLDIKCIKSRFQDKHLSRWIKNEAGDYRNRYGSRSNQR
jgi:hypothetical protein